jgi:hypothetical protein
MGSSSLMDALRKRLEGKNARSEQDTKEENTSGESDREDGDKSADGSSEHPAKKLMQLLQADEEGTAHWDKVAKAVLDCSKYNK